MAVESCMRCPGWTRQERKPLVGGCVFAGLGGVCCLVMAGAPLPGLSCSSCVLVFASSLWVFLRTPPQRESLCCSSSVCIYYYYPGALLLWRWGARQDTNWSQWNLILSVAVFELWTFELCVFLCVAFLCGLVAPSCLTFYDPMDCSLPVLSMEFSEWVVIPFSKESSRPWEWTWVSCITGRFFTTEPPGKA